MKTSVIIPAAGQSYRWNNYLGVPKQLAPLGKSGRVLINRTINILRSHGVNNIYVFTTDSLIAKIVKNAQIKKPEKSDSLADTILSSCEKWSEKTIIMLGDVFYSRQCIETILKDNDDLKFFGVPIINKLNKRSELYAFLFNHSEQKRILKNLETGSKIAHLRKNGNLLLNAAKEALVNDTDYLKKLFTYCYPAKPPRLFRKTGLRRNVMWRIYRALIRKPHYDWMFGKLWGLFIIMDLIDPFGSENYKWPDYTGNLLETIDDITQDIDTKEDYIELMEKRNTVEQTCSA